MLEELVAQPHCIYVYGCNKICLNLKAVKATVQKQHLRNKKKVFRIYVLLLYCYL